MNVNIYNPVAGEVLPITDVNDFSFSDKLLGEGFGVEPSNGKIYAPVDGKISTIFKMKHAFSIQVTERVELLIHMGINTLTIEEGSPFTLFIEEGQSVEAGDLLAEVDLAALDALLKERTIICAITSMEWIQDFKLHQVGQAAVGDLLASFDIPDNAGFQAKEFTNDSQ